MITKNQYRRLCRMMNQGCTLKEAAEKSGMDGKTARKYFNADNPFQRHRSNKVTRKDPFQEVWPEIEEMLQLHPRLEAKTVFFYLMSKYPGHFQEGQLRTLQRRFKEWKGLYGSPKEVYFEQQHYPAELSESDFTRMNKLNITICGKPFSHMIYHFVLTYSNWESISICYSENLESLLEGVQNAFWQLGGVPKRHRSDRLSAAVRNFKDSNQFTTRYETLMKSYNVKIEKIQTGRPNENGDVEQAHHRFKRAVDQALMLRGNRDFFSLEEYRVFLKDLVNQRNSARSKRFQDESPLLGPLSVKRIPDWSELKVRVSRGSTIRVRDNRYSVPSRLIGEIVDVKIGGSTITVYFAGKFVEEFPRLSGSHKANIDYRHVIDWLIRKPGAFDHYRYKEELYPTTTFRAVYDALKSSSPNKYIKEYLTILRVACQNGQQSVEAALRHMLKEGQISSDRLIKLLSCAEKIISFRDVTVAEVDLKAYDLLLKDMNE